MSDDSTLIRDALEHLRDRGSHPGDFERGDEALAALDAIETEARRVLALIEGGSGSHKRLWIAEDLCRAVLAAEEERDE